MTDSAERGQDRPGLSRRGLLQLGVAGSLGVAASSLWAQTPDARAILAEATAQLRYLTPPDQFREFEREKPRVDQLPPENLRQSGLDRETWRLEVVPDPQSNCKVDRPLSQKLGTALDWTGLMKLAETRAVRFLHVLTCTNMPEPMGIGLWEGVPLREIVWLARLIVPGAYGNKSVKWLQSVVLTNDYQANDTYALWNNDVETSMKTQARFLKPPAQVKAGQPVPLVGLAQVGMSGLSKVQYSIESDGTPRAADDPYFTKADWKDAELLPPPQDWGGGLPGGKLPPIPLQLDPATGRPRSWPLRYTIVHWGTLVTDLRPGSYRLRCRTIDANGMAQPMPRPFPKSGNNAIHEVPLVVEA